MALKEHQILLCIILWLCSTYSLAGYQISVNEKNGLPLIHNSGSLILTAEYAFWEKDWVWAGQETEFETNAQFSYTASGNNNKLDFNLNSSVQRIKSNEISWDFSLNAKSSKKDIVGGGIVFKLGIPMFDKDHGEPVLLPDNQGWRWGNLTNQGIEVRFEPALVSIYFERGRKSEIRAFFYKGEIPEGKRQYMMTITLFGDIAIKPTISERFGTNKTQRWQKNPIDWQSFPLDFSFLNAAEKPAGKHGFIRAQGDELIFEDDTKTRFWGTNISAYTLFKTSKINIKKQAKRLSKMGFNLVRLHHHDSWWVDPNIFGAAKTTRNTQQLSKQSFDQLDWWIKCLKDEGIYVWLDLHVQRYLTTKDNIFAFDEINKNKKQKGVDLKGYNYVNLTIKNAMKRFNRAYVTHVNKYTKLAYKDEPAIIAMLLTNENDITNHFGNALLPDKNVPMHSKIFMHEAKVFANQYNLPPNRVWRSWEHGPSKLFLNDLEYRFNDELIRDLRKTGVKVPIVTTSTWGGNPLSSLPALTVGDMIDVHVYGGVLELEKNPLVTPGMTTWMTAGQVANKPISISEWNVSPFPAPDRHVSPLLVASKASHQGWDALMQYAYAQNSLDFANKPSNWHAHNDPSLLSTLPAAALLYRKGHIKEATTTYYFSPGEALFNETISPGTSLAVRTASEKGKLLIAMPKLKYLPWLMPTTPPEDAILIEDYRQSLIEQNALFVSSDTGELVRNWEKGIYTVNTKQSQAVMGWIGNNTITLADTEFRLTTRNATVAVQSLDDIEINLSKNILISLSTNSIPYKDLKNQDSLPFYSEPIQGKIFIKARKGLHLSYLTNSGIKTDLDVNYSDGQYVIELDKVPLTNWLQLTL